PEAVEHHQCRCPSLPWLTWLDSERWEARAMRRFAQEFRILGGMEACWRVYRDLRLRRSDIRQTSAVAGARKLDLRVGGGPLYEVDVTDTVTGDVFSGVGYSPVDATRNAWYGAVVSRPKARGCRS
ncbi:hypothetical protein KIH27_21620, partial [Mycobacterium sp. M1]